MPNAIQTYHADGTCTIQVLAKGSDSKVVDTFGPTRNFAQIGTFVSQKNLRIVKVVNQAGHAPSEPYRSKTRHQT